MADSFNDFMEYLQQLSDLRRGAGMQPNISELQSLLRRWRVGRDSGSLPGRISKTLMYGEAQNLKRKRT